MIDILAVFPHPDDETWIAGGTLAQCVDSGLDVRVVSLTAGEKGWDRTGQYSTEAEMADVRTREFYAACTALAIDNSAVLEFSDGTLTANEVSAWLAEEVERHRPRFLLTFGEDGGYGHVDHIATFDAVRSLIDDGADGFTWLTTIASSGRTVDIWRALRKLRTSAPIVVSDFPDRRRRSIKRPMQTVPLTDAALERKLEALRAHRSQLRNEDPRSFVDEQLMATLLGEETLSFQHGTPADFGQLIREITP